MTLYVFCRFLNVGLYLLVLTAYFVRSNDRWASYVFGVKLKRVGIGSLFLLISVGSANAYINHIPPTWVTPCVTASGLAVLVGLLLSRGHKDP